MFQLLRGCGRRTKAKARTPLPCAAARLHAALSSRALRDDAGGVFTADSHRECECARAHDVETAAALTSLDEHARIAANRQAQKGKNRRIMSGGGGQQHARQRRQVGAPEDERRRGRRLAKRGETRQNAARPTTTSVERRRTKQASGRRQR